MIRMQSMILRVATVCRSLRMVEDFKALVEAAEPDATIVLKEGTYVISDKLLIEKVCARAGNVASPS